MVVRILLLAIVFFRVATGFRDYYRESAENVIMVHSFHLDRIISQLRTWVPQAFLYNFSIVYVTPGRDKNHSIFQHGVGPCPSMKHGCKNREGSRETLASFEWVHSIHPRLKFLYKTDDDSMNHIPRLAAFIRQISNLGQENAFMIWGRCEDKRVRSLTNPLEQKNNPGGFFCGGGPGYVMSRKTIETLYESKLKCLQHMDNNDDVFVTRCILQLGGKTVYHRGFFEEAAPIEARDYWIAQHHLRPSEMIKIFRDSGFNCTAVDEKEANREYHSLVKRSEEQETENDRTRKQSENVIKQHPALKHVVSPLVKQAQENSKRLRLIHG